MIRLPVEPMLAAPQKAPTFEDGQWRFGPPFHQAGWAFEPKYDGNRCIAVRESGKVLLYSRSGRILNSEFPSIIEPLRELWNSDADFVLDGELLAYDENGQTSFNTIQRRMLDRVRIEYRPFDVLFTSYANSTERWPYETRRKLLEVILNEPPDGIRITPVVNDGIMLWNAILETGGEGIIAKPIGSIYRQGQRGPWLKVKVLQQREATIIGYTSGEGSRYGIFGALVLATETPEGWKYAGKVGTGFTLPAAVDLLRKMTPLRQQMPVLERGEFVRIRTELGPRSVTWIRPVLRAKVEYSEIGRGGVPRFPSFKGVIE